MSKLQLALDTLSIDECIDLLTQLDGLIDIVEIGTPFIMEEGVKVLTLLKNKFPNQKFLADLKIADGAKIETASALKAGADMVTVLGLSEKQTIIDCVETAHKAGKEVLVDMLAVDDIQSKAKQLDELGVDYLCVHNGFDVQSVVASPLQELIELKKANVKAKIAAVGGIKLNTLSEIMKLNPDLVIIGGAITNAQDPKDVTLKMLEIIKG